MSLLQAPDLAAWRYGLEGALTQHKAALIEELQRQLAPTNSSPYELRYAAQVLLRAYRFTDTVPESSPVLLGVGRWQAAVLQALLRGVMVARLVLPP